MSKSRRAKARAQRRQRVNRNERVKPSALAEAKKRPWPMQVLLQRGPEAGGISAEQFEAGLEIVDAYEALTRSCGWHSASLDRVTGNAVADDLSPREVRLIAIYLQWVVELITRLRLPGAIIVDWITDTRSLGTIGLPILIRALDLWTKQRDDWWPGGLTSDSHAVLTSARRGVPATHRPDPQPPSSRAAGR